MRADACAFSGILLAYQFDGDAKKFYSEIPNAAPEIHGVEESIGSIGQ